MNFVFAGTPDFAVPSLAALLGAGYIPNLVLTQPDRPAGRGQHLQPPPVKKLALDYGLRVRQPAKLSEVREELEGLQPQVMVVVAYAHKIPNWLLALPPWGCLNVHGSLLPRYRGASPITAALLNGDTEAGVSIMRLEEGWDTGPVLKMRGIPVAPDDNAGTLTNKLAQLGAELLLEVIHGLEAGELTAAEQDHSRATYAPKLTKGDGLLYWSRSAEQLSREVRAYNPWPGSHTFWEGKQLKVLHVHLVEGPIADAPVGTVLPGLVVVTGDGLLGLDRIQLEGRKAVTAKEFLAGQSSIVGSRLG